MVHGLLGVREAWPGGYTVLSTGNTVLTVSHVVHKQFVLNSDTRSADSVH